MFKLEVLIAIIIDLIRTVLIEAASDRVRRLKLPRRLRGMRDVRRYVHRKTRERLLNRLSTEIRL
jgi:hypothetical protein